MNKEISFILILIAVVAMTSSASTKATLETAFPRVYTAITATPKDDSPSVPRFASYVDIIRVKQNNDATATISFIVHNNNELIRLENLASSPPTQTIGGIQVDADATTALHEKINFVGPQSRAGSPYTTIKDFPCYKNLQGSFKWMDAMVKRAKSIPGLSVSKKDIGNSYLKTQNATNGYNIWALKVTGTAPSGIRKGIFFVMSGLHPREYAPPELASRWVESLIDSYGKKADITAMLNYTEIHLVLQANPDGREEAERDRELYIRKNRNPSSGFCSSDSIGVDLNRNFPFRYGLDSGSSSFECDETYRGVSAGSEPEVEAIVKYTKSIFPVAQRKAKPNIQQQVAYPEKTTVGVFVDIHSSGNLVDFPWSYSDAISTPNIDGYRAAIEKVKRFTKYTEDIGYSSSGTSDDYAYGLLGAAGMTFEIGSDFYQDCDSFENIYLPRDLKGLTYLSKISKAPFSLGKGPDITKLSPSVQGGKLTIIGTASDSALSAKKVETTKQTVKRIDLFVNKAFSYDVARSPTYRVQTLAKKNSTVSWNVTIGASSLPRGRHVVYAIATDSDGYQGPATAAYFNKK